MINSVCECLNRSLSVLTSTDVEEVKCSSVMASSLVFLVFIQKLREILQVKVWKHKLCYSQRGANDPVYNDVVRSEVVDGHAKVLFGRGRKKREKQVSKRMIMGKNLRQVD